MDELQSFQERFFEPKLTGEGATAKVYRVKERTSGKYYALKVLQNEILWRQEKESLELADHGLFVKLEEAGEEDGHFYLLTEYAFGDPLSEAIDRRGGFTQPEAMRIAIAVADGLAYLQQQRTCLVYRDLKAENLILCPDGNVKLVDLGCVCRISLANRATAGTPGCSAPEQFDENGFVGAYSDVYAFGRLYYYLLTGDNPAGKDELPTLRQKDPGFSSQLELLIYRCTCKEVSLRPADMYEVLQLLVDIAMENGFTYRRMERRAAKQMKEIMKQ